MVLGNKILNAIRESMLLGKFQAVLHVTDNDPRAAIRIQRLVRIDPFLILGKERRAIHFSNVMIKGAHSHQRAVSLNALRRLFGEIGNHNTVMLRAGRAAQEIF